MMRNLPFGKRLLLSALLGLFLLPVVAQNNPNEVSWSGNGFYIKKVVSNTTIPSGVNFSYTIIFSAPPGTPSITIQDVVPSTLTVVSIAPLSPVCGNTPTVNVSGNTVTYSLIGLSPSCTPSGSFTIVVRFPEGVTCNGTAARNRAGIMVDGQYQYTEYVSTTATAADPWVIGKSIVSGAVVNPNGGSCGYLIPLDGTVTYRLSVMKGTGFWGNVTGQTDLSGGVVTDILPPGAVFVSSTCGAYLVGNTITWNIGNLNAANPWAYYYCDIQIQYPAAQFPNGSQATNQTTLTGTVCQQQAVHNSNQTCVEVGQVTPNPNAYFAKYLSLTNRVPGCQGYYQIVFCNNGNVPLAPFNITDAIPSGISIDYIQVYGANATTMISLSANSGANILASNLTSTWTSTNPIGLSISDLNLQMTGSLPVGQCIYMMVYFTVGSNPTGTQVSNCATFVPLTNSLTLNPACATFTVEAGHPEPCLLKDICSPKPDYSPGDTVRFRIRVQNIGSATLTGATLTDVLHSNFSYIGNESYFVANTYNPTCTSGSSIPPFTTAWTGVTPAHSGNNLSWNLPPIASDCQLFYTGYCGYYGTWTLPYYFIEFDVVVDSLALPGVTPNNYSISGGNLTSTYTSNTVNVLVVASFGQEAEKLVSTNGGSTFAASGTVAPGGTARYQLKYKNMSNVPVTSVNLVDLLGRDDGSNDWLILNRSVARGSQFDVSYLGSHSTSLLPVASPPTPTLEYANGPNICLPPFGINTGCTSAPWGSTPDRNIRVNYGSWLMLPALSVMEQFNVGIPSNATIGQKVCNDFAAISTATFLLNGNPQSVALTPIAAAPVCLTVQNPVNCCDSVRLTQVQGADCCVRLTTTCDVKMVTAQVGGGTLGSVSWNCGNLPSGYQGQSSWDFPANNCALDMNVCIDALQPGASVNFVIHFSNGQTCEKSIKLDCKTSSSCCALVDFRLKSKWPFWKTLVGQFNITNLDPSVPICHIDITPAPAGSFSTGALWIDGTPSTQSWNPTRIPATGNLSPAAVNSIKFSLVASNYNGAITVCVVKCDGTTCCFDFNWNTKPIDNTDLGIDQPAIGVPLVAVNIRPVVNTPLADSIKYVSFGLNDESEIVSGGPQFFAISAAGQPGDDYPEGLAVCDNSFMGSYNAFFELRQPHAWDEPLGAFHLVFTQKVPKLGCTLFDKDGNVLFTGAIEVNASTGVSTSSEIQGGAGMRPDMFEFLNTWPNPGDGQLTVSYATGSLRDVEIQVIDAKGTVLYTTRRDASLPGIHNVPLDATLLPKGNYFIRLVSNGEMKVKPVIFR